MPFQLRKPTVALPRREKQRATFGDAHIDTTPDPVTLEERRELVIQVILAAKQPNGKPFEFEERYNLLGRGLNALQKDFAAHAGRALTDDELENFDHDALLKGKDVVVEVKHKKVGTKLVAYIASYHPAEPAAVETT